MSRSIASVGRQLGSVCLRYPHPYILGAVPTGLPRAPQTARRAIIAGNSHSKVGGEPVDRRVVSLEALLFLSRQPLTSRKLAQLANLADGTKARTLVRTLNRRYDASGSAFRVEEVAGGFQLLTRAKFAPWLRRLCAASSEIRLSPPAMETLAVVAYRQPVLRTEIEGIRGVQSGEVLRQLIERDLVRIAGRSEELGRPFLYGTTRQFLQTFGLRHLDELPRADVLRSGNTAPAANNDIQNRSDSSIPNPTNQSQIAAEEENVKTLTTKPQHVLAQERFATMTKPRRNDRTAGQEVLDKHEDEEEEDEDLDDDEDFEDEEDFDDEDEEEDEEEEDDEDLDDEPWEEVDDDDEEEDDDDEEDEDWDDDDDWEDEDWDEDDDWDDDEDEDEDEDEDKGSASEED
jgi:segregation and condensation protein B